MTGVPEHPGRTPLKSRLQNPSKKLFKNPNFCSLSEYFGNLGDCCRSSKYFRNNGLGTNGHTGWALARGVHFMTM